MNSIMATDGDKQAITMRQEQQDEQLLLDWTKKQGRILTAGGRAEEYYTAERGFAYKETELPHHYLLQQTTHEIFAAWKRREDKEKASPSPIVGAWKRVLFYGGWEHSTDRDEYSFNLQTHSLFIDLRIPFTRHRVFSSGQQTTSTTIQSLDDLSAQQLRWYARQHVFAGYSLLSKPQQTPASNKFDACCARHHCIDWNFVGKGRTRPNKWWIDLITKTMPGVPTNQWKEWAYATDDHGQHYYCERWERLEGGAPSPVLALRKCNHARDGVLIVVGDHFSFCLNRQIDLALLQSGPYENCVALVDLVDAAIDGNDLATARAWLGLQGGHGRISRGWKLDHCIEFWREGRPLWQQGEVEVQGDSIENATVVWNREVWDVFECSLATVDDLRKLLLSQ